MIVVLEIPAETMRRIVSDGRAARRFPAVLAKGINAAAVTAADEVRQDLIAGRLGLANRHGAFGLAGSIMGWMLDPDLPRAAVGVPGDNPAANYALIQQRGGTILPTRAASLAIPISDEAKGFTSPRDMAGLVLIKRPGRPSLLVRMLEARGRRRANWQIHWVLVKSVTLTATHWLTDGVSRARGAMRDAFQGVLDRFASRYGGD